MPVDAILAIREVITMAIAAATVGLIAYSPIARAIGNRILHGRLPAPGAGADAGRVDDLSDEVAALRRQVQETQERVDFAERLLAQARERGVLGAGREG